MDIDVKLTQNPRTIPEYGKDQVPFGKLFTDHMFLMDYSVDKGWHDARILPYGDILLSPAANSIHYGQSIFEGMKAYKSPGDNVLLFRPFENAARFNASAHRMCMPEIMPEAMVEAVARLVEIDKGWIPKVPGMSLYIRPFMFATEAMVNVTLPETFMFGVLLSPVGSIMGTGEAMRLVAEEEYVRAAPGGTGAAKCAGNYAAAMRAVTQAKAKGYDQVLWLDATHRRYVEEASAMNVFFVMGDTVVTPELTGTILEGITRKSVIDILRGWGWKVEERKLAIDEVVEAAKAGSLTEAFSAGTAAVIGPIGEITWGDQVVRIGGVGELTKRVYDELTGIQTGTRPDERAWVYKVC